MKTKPSHLTLLPFPQHWNADTRELRLRFLCVPSRPPLLPLAPGLASFADAHLSFEVLLIDGLERTPLAADISSRLPITLNRLPTHKRALFEALARQIDIDPNEPPVPGAARFRKAAPESYRQLLGTRPLSPYLSDPQAFDCALEHAHGQQAEEPPPPPAPSLRWGQLIALALRQPVLAQALGLVGEGVVVIPASAMAEGGWLGIRLASDSDFAQLHSAGLSFAARLPELAATRNLYAAVLFPFDDPSPLDGIEAEAARYDDGLARRIHGRVAGQPTDAIELGWDDEQVATWLNRQVDLATVCPMGTAGYRVDVRLAGAEGPWHSLQRLRNTQATHLGPIELAPANMEYEDMIAVVPSKAHGAASDYWMPPYFATWRGRSLVASDPDMLALHRQLGQGYPLQLRPLSPFEAVTDDAVDLRYGRDYEFRVRLCDLSGGGPAWDIDEAQGPGHTPMPGADTTITRIAFRRTRIPRKPEVLKPATRDDPVLRVQRPMLPYPALRFAGASTADALAELKSRMKQASGKDQELALPDPDVDRLQVSLEVRALTGDGEAWHVLYQLEVPFGGGDVLELPMRFLDIPRLADMEPHVAGLPLPVPTARDVRIRLRAIGRDVPDYYADDAVRQGEQELVELHVRAAVEEPWLSAPVQVRAAFLRSGSPHQVALPIERLADLLNLRADGHTLRSQPGRRVVMAASSALGKVVSPDAASLSFPTDADACLQWLVALDLQLARDWSWRGMAACGIAVYRRVQRGHQAPGPRVLVGHIPLPSSLAVAVQDAPVNNPRAEIRQSTDLWFFDAYDPKPTPAGPLEEWPAEITLHHELVAQYSDGSSVHAVHPTPIRLPVTSPPVQTPRVVSAGVAFSAFAAAVPETTTQPDDQRLWLEMESAPLDPGDAYFVRVLAVGPDPLLTDLMPEPVVEPVLPVDPEWTRLVTPGQSTDSHGVDAMQAVVVGHGSDGYTVALPLPPGVAADSPALFGLYTYEIRVGHADGRWCTAQGRYGPPLRLTGVQHPPPRLGIQVSRDASSVHVHAPYATPVHRGAVLLPPQPKTRLWALLYAQVRQVNGEGWNHLLLQQRLMETRSPEARNEPHAQTRFPLDQVQEQLKAAGLPKRTTLAVVVAEVHADAQRKMPLGSELGSTRLLRVSALRSVSFPC